MLNQFFLDTNGGLSPEVLQQRGPAIAVEISVPAVLADQLAKTGAPMPQPIVGDALIDTGASMTCTDEEILAGLGLQPVSQISMSTPSDNQAQTYIYVIRLTFPQVGIPVSAANLTVAAAKLKNQGYSALLGRNFLRNLVLTYNGPGGFYTLAFQQSNARAPAPASVRLRSTARTHGCSRRLSVSRSRRHVSRTFEVRCLQPCVDAHNGLTLAKRAS